MPFSRARADMHGDQAFPEQAVSGTMSAIIIARRELYWKISQTELRIDRDLAPHTGVSGIRPGIVQPGIDSELPRLGDCMEDPETLAGASVESTDVTFDVGLALRH